MRFRYRVRLGALMIVLIGLTVINRTGTLETPGEGDGKGWEMAICGIIAIANIATRQLRMNSMILYSYLNAANGHRLGFTKTVQDL